METEAELLDEGVGLGALEGLDEPEEPEALGALEDTADVPEAATTAAPLSDPCDDPSRPSATTAPAVPPAITNHPTANAATVARRRPAPGIPTSGTVQHL